MPPGVEPPLVQQFNTSDRGPRGGRGDAPSPHRHDDPRDDPRDAPRRGRHRRGSLLPGTDGPRRHRRLRHLDAPHAPRRPRRHLLPRRRRDPPVPLSPVPGRGAEGVAALVWFSLGLPTGWSREPAETAPRPRGVPARRGVSGEGGGLGGPSRGATPSQRPTEPTAGVLERGRLQLLQEDCEEDGEEQVRGHHPAEVRREPSPHLVPEGAVVRVLLHEPPAGQPLPREDP